MQEIMLNGRKSEKKIAYTAKKFAAVLANGTQVL
jgi:hypothetical protein